MMPGHESRCFGRDTLKPKNPGSTLARFGTYFKQWWPVLLLVIVFMVINAWSQVGMTRIPGQAVDCYLFPLASSRCEYTARNAVVIDADPNLTAEAKRDEKLQGMLG